MRPVCFFGQEESDAGTSGAGLTSKAELWLGDGLKQGPVWCLEQSERLYQAQTSLACSIPWCCGDSDQRRGM